MNKLKSFYRNSVIPRLFFIPYWIYKLLLLPVVLFNKIVRRDNSKSFEPKLCIESGVRGWERLDYKEYYFSACEYLGEGRVFKIVINKEDDYVKKIITSLKCIKPTHYLYNPQTGSQNGTKGFWQAFRISIFLHIHGIIPICLLTDLPVRTWRTQCALVSAFSGVVIGLMLPRNIQSIFPHNRFVSPTLFPLSETTMGFIDGLYQKKKETELLKATFIGSLYEPRTTILKKINENLNKKGYDLEMKSRALGSEKFSDYDYWSSIVNAKIIITTSEQLESRNTDWTWFPHLIYRYLEVCACGTLLVAPEVPGIRRYLTPGVHFAAFSLPEDAANKIIYYLENPEEREKIALQGRARIKAIVNSHTHWIGIDIALGKNSLI